MPTPTQNTNPYFFQEENSIDLKSEIRKYVRFWPYFVVAILLAFAIAYFYTRYAPRIYQTTAKIKILDESDGLELLTSGFVFKRSNINLENEIEILTSYRIIEQVVRQLQLNTTFYEEGQIQTSQLAHLPFQFEQTIAPDSIVKSSSYQINSLDNGLEIIDLRTEKSMLFPDHNTFSTAHNLPFEIAVNGKQQINESIGKKYIVKFSPLKPSVLSLKSRIAIEAIGEMSHLLQLTIKSESTEWSENVLNTLIEVFDEDGINDRRMVSKNTRDFIDDRFVDLAKELDSVEIDKKEFKQDNNLVFLPNDAELGLQRKTQSEEEVFKIENQLSLAKLVSEALIKSDDKGLLPANIGIESGGINALITDYNTAVLERDKYRISGGANNPMVKQLNATILDLRSNINRSLQSYINQLDMSLNQLESRNSRLSGEVSRLPEKEKLLRAIERQQNIKESLYLILLQKREEAAINFAITEPSVKIVEYALSGSGPISPKTNVIYAAAILAGLMIPFGALYLFFMLDTKVHDKKDVEKLVTNVPILGEIPLVKDKQSLVFKNPNDHSILAESFRILSSNVNYVLPPIKNEGKVIFCTSTIKGEGKTFVSMNLSLALSSLNKKVLLIGADLRNPQIHNYIDKKKNDVGLSSYLHDEKVDWKTLLIKGFDEHPRHDILLSGSIPPNPSHLLANGRFEQLIEEAKDLYEYIIVDTTPTILVTDTMLISSLADATLYMVRANFTEKDLLEFSKNMHASGKLKNMAYVINAVGSSKSKGYGYNYGYGYGYGKTS